MSRHRTRIAIVVALAMTLAWPLAAQEDMPEMDAEQAAMMEAWMKAGTPGEAHEWLSGFVGNWKLEIKSWMDPASEPMVSMGTAERSMVMDGRVLQETMQSDMMGTPFSGRSLTGYNNVTGKYWGTWIDTMSTGVFVSHGSRDADSGAITLDGEFVNPMTGGTTKTRSIMHAEGDDKMVFAWYEDHGEGEMKTMEITYTRE